MRVAVITVNSVYLYSKPTTGMLCTLSYFLTTQKPFYCGKFAV